MAIVSVAPVIWGISTGHLAEAEWVTLAGEGIAWVSLKGTYGQRLRVLAGGTFLAALFGALGSVTGDSFVLSVIGMVIVAFLAGLFKNLGDRGSGLSICLYVMFLITNAHAVYGAHLVERVGLIVAGGAWNALVAIAVFVFMPAQQPYRRTIALIWRANVALIQKIGRGWDGKTLRSSQREVYQSEKDVRAAIDQSLGFYEAMAHQVSKKKDQQEYQLAQVRKAASLVAAHLGAINEELESLRLYQLDMNLRLKIADLFKAAEEAARRMSVYVLSMREEEAVLVRARLERLATSVTLVQEHRGGLPERTAKAIRRVVHLAERVIRLTEKSMERLQRVEDRPVYRSYSFIRTILTLHPKHWLRNIRLLFYFNTLTMRHALRTALAAGIAMIIYKGYGIGHGYWLPFTVIIILQPYFGATWKKAGDRILGTVTGGLAGGLLLLLPAGLHLKEIMLFVSAVAMVYFFRIRYSITTFFITLNLVLLFAVSEELSPSLILTRALCTLGGAAIAVLAGYVLLPTWDRKWLPRHLVAALRRNYEYFTATFFNPKSVTGWTRYKRQAETEISNAYDSFNRYMQEPGAGRKGYSTYFQFITHNVRLTRDLNNIHLEEEHKDEAARAQPPTPEQTKLVLECLEWFHHCLSSIPLLHRKEKATVPPPATQEVFFHLNRQQVVYLEKILVELKAMQANLDALGAIGN